MIIGPIHDLHGNLKGIIQLVNKHEDDAITEQDQKEIESLLPAIGEIIRTADKVRLITNISAGLDEHLCKNERIIVETAKQLEDKSMNDIHNALTTVKESIYHMADCK